MQSNVNNNVACDIQNKTTITKKKTNKQNLVNYSYHIQSHTHPPSTAGINSMKLATVGTKKKGTTTTITAILISFIIKEKQQK